MPEEPEPAEDDPGASAETILFLASTEALVGTLGRNRGERLLLAMADRLVAAGAGFSARRARSVFLAKLPRIIELLPRRRK